MPSSPFAPNPEEDEEEEGYHGPAAVLLPSSVAASAGQPPIPYLAQPSQQQTPPQPVAAPQAVAPQAAPQMAYPSMPDAPTSIIPQYQAMTDKRTKDATVDAKANAPKWWERLAGGLVGAGVGYQQGATAGIAAGGRVTTRRYDAALDDSRQKVAADDAQLDNLQRMGDMNRKAYEDQVTNFGGKMQIARAQQEQGNADRTNAREAANDAFNQTTRNRELSNTDRTFDFEKQVHGDTVQNENARLAEETRAHRVSEGLEGQRVGIERQRANQSGGGDGQPSLVAPMTANQFHQFNMDHDHSWNQAEAQYAGELAADPTPAAQEKVRQKYEGPGGVRDQMQARWNTEYAQVDPMGLYAPKGQSPQAAPAAAATGAAPQGVVPTGDDQRSGVTTGVKLTRRFIPNAAPSAPPPQPAATRTIVDGKGNRRQVTTRNGKWVDAQTLKPI